MIGPFQILVSVLLLPAAGMAQAAHVLLVGPAAPFPTIQAAVNAAVDGDVVFVAPGAYPAFSITGKAVSVVAVDPAHGPAPTFTVASSAASPGILIEGLSPGQQVTVAGARVAHAATACPAVLVRNNPGGAVHLLDVAVTLATNLGAVSYDGLVEARHAGAVRMTSVRAGDHRVFGNGAAGTDGLAGLFGEATYLHLDACRFSGLRSSDPLIAGGDGVRTIGPCTAWIVDSTLIGGFCAAGATPNGLGGHALQDFDGQAQRLQTCDCTLVSTVATVSIFAIATQPAALLLCDTETIVRTSIVPFSTTVAIGTGIAVAVTADRYQRAFATVVGFGFDCVPTPPGLEGAILVSDSPAVLTAGYATGPLSLPLVIPLLPWAIGLQITLQTAMSDPFGTPTMSLSTATGFHVG